MTCSPSATPATPADARAALDSAISSPVESPVESSLLCAVFVPGHPVSCNSMYGARRGTYAKRLTAEATAWRDAIANSLLQYRLPARQQRRQPLAVSFTVVGVRGDADNYAKLVCDGVKIGLLVDDRYFQRVTAAKRRCDAIDKQPGVYIYVNRLSEPPQPTKRPRRKGAA